MASGVIIFTVFLTLPCAVLIRLVSGRRPDILSAVFIPILLLAAFAGYFLMPVSLYLFSPVLFLPVLAACFTVIFRDSRLRVLLSSLFSCSVIYPVLICHRLLTENLIAAEGTGIPSTGQTTATAAVAGGIIFLFCGVYAFMSLLKTTSSEKRLYSIKLSFSAAAVILSWAAAGVLSGQLLSLSFKFAAFLPPAVISVFFYFFIKTVLQEMADRRENRSRQQLLNSIDNIRDEFSKFQKNSLNSVHSFAGHIYTSTPGELKEHYISTVASCRDFSRANFKELYKIKNSAFAALIEAYLRKCDDSNARLILNVTNETADFYIGDGELCFLAEKILDRALEYSGPEIEITINTGDSYAEILTCGVCKGKRPPYSDSDMEALLNGRRNLVLSCYIEEDRLTQHLCIYKKTARLKRFLKKMA